MVGSAPAGWDRFDDRLKVFDLRSGFFFDDGFVTTDEKYMKRAIALAQKGSGWVNPNPMVGAVVVKNDRIIGEGFHEYFGGPHAEVNALKDLNWREQPGLLHDASLYVTLEPCSHQGKTPPCAHLIAESGIRKVVVGMADSNPLVNGKGIGFLQSHDVEVVTGVLEAKIRKLNEVFIKYITTGWPFVVLKTAMTLDGKIATVNNASRWITGTASRTLVHRMRQQLAAVMVGADTVIYDDPLLNIRLKPGRGKNRIFPGQPVGNRTGPAVEISAQDPVPYWKNPLKIVVDSHARIPLHARVLMVNSQLAILATTDAAPEAKLRDIKRLGAQVLVCPVKEGRVDLRFLMESMGVMGIDSIMVEGGSALAFSALKEGIVDKVVSFIAPKILGGDKAPTPVGGEGIAAMEDALPLFNVSYRKTGNDLLVEGYLKEP